MKKPALLWCSLVFFVSSFSQSQEVLQIRNYRSSHEKELIDGFVSFLSIPNVAADTVGLKMNAGFLLNWMRSAGIEKTYLLTPVTPGAAPVVYGEKNFPGAKATLIFYAHYDGQPVNP